MLGERNLLLYRQITNGLHKGFRLPFDGSLGPDMSFIFVKN